MRAREKVHADFQFECCVDKKPSPSRNNHVPDEDRHFHIGASFLKRSPKTLTGCHSRPKFGVNKQSKRFAKLQTRCFITEEQINQSWPKPHSCRFPPNQLSFGLVTLRNNQSCYDVTKSHQRTFKIISEQ